VDVKLNELFIADIDREAPLTRRALEAFPEGRDDWKPHPKSMPLGRLASMLALMPSWLALQVETEELDLAPAAGAPPSSFSRQFRNAAELTTAMDEAVAGARRALQACSDARLMETWRLKMKEQVVASGPRHVMMRDTLMHLSHHRGQLTVYLRLNDVKVPAIYGPSADDQRF
jgi:uncharacterized damage-inducible protein DinB